MKRGLDGRANLLFLLMVGEGIGLLAFGHAPTVGLAIATMTVFGVFTHMACGANYALVPFVDRKALGGVTGLVGAGGNVGGVLAGFLLKYTGSAPVCLSYLGWIVLGCSLCALTVRFSASHKASEQALLANAMAARVGTLVAAE